MAENSKIEWCDATVNMWWGCAKVSPGCAHCYADTWSRRCGKDIWGHGKPREDHRAGASKLAMRLEQTAAAGRFRECSVCGKREIRKWDRSLPPGGLACCSNPECVSLPETESSVVRPRVFCSSMSDWLDDEVPIKWLADLLALIHATPNLDWLLLTKRPQNWAPRVLAAGINLGQRNGPTEWVRDWLSGAKPPASVWIGTSVEDQKRADERINQLLAIPARVRFLSCEPLLGSLDLAMWLKLGSIHWVIAGGESGPKARPIHPEWVRSLRDQCAAASVPFLFKQWGEWGPCPIGDGPDLVTNAVFKRGPGHDGEVWKVGKKAAGRTLDGREWNAFPRLPGCGL